MNSQNRFSALRAAFPSDLDATAVETDEGLNYSWRDLERGSAKMANLFASLDLPPGSRIAAQVEKSPEALMLYLATVRAGFVYLPLNTAYRSDEMAYFIGNASPAVVVCSPSNFGWVSQIAFRNGTKHLFTLDEPHYGHNSGRNSGSLLSRAAHHADAFDTVQRDADDLARWTGDLLTRGSGWNDAVLFSRCWEDDPASLNELAMALSASRERHLETTQLGRAFRIAAGVFAPPVLAEEEIAYPIAAGSACAAMGIGRHDALLAFLQGFGGFAEVRVGGDAFGGFGGDVVDGGDVHLRLLRHFLQFRAGGEEVVDFLDPGRDYDRGRALCAGHVGDAGGLAVALGGGGFLDVADVKHGF